MTQFKSFASCEAWEGQEDQQVVADPNPDLEGEEKDRGVKAYRIIDKDASWEAGEAKDSYQINIIECFIQWFVAWKQKI